MTSDFHLCLSSDGVHWTEKIWEELRTISESQRTIERLLLPFSLKNDHTFSRKQGQKNCRNDHHTNFPIKEMTQEMVMNLIFDDFVISDDLCTTSKSVSPQPLFRSLKILDEDNKNSIEHCSGHHHLEKIRLDNTTSLSNKQNFSRDFVQRNKKFQDSFIRGNSNDSNNSHEARSLSIVSDEDLTDDSGHNQERELNSCTVISVSSPKKVSVNDIFSSSSNDDNANNTVGSSKYCSNDTNSKIDFGDKSALRQDYKNQSNQLINSKKLERHGYLRRVSKKHSSKCNSIRLLEGIQREVIESNIILQNTRTILCIDNPQN